MIMTFLQILVIIFCFVAVSAIAQHSPIGDWYTKHPDFKVYTSITRVYQQSDGTLAGKIIKMLPIDGIIHNRCKKCKGWRYNKPFLGMDVIWGFERAKNGQSWKNGWILDGKRGLIVRGKIWLSKNGRSLYVRGYYGGLFTTVKWDRR